MTNSTRDIEILAPCGSYDILIAAIHAGADACYIGGNRFGARAYAQNFDQNSIIQAIDYAHIHGVKIYLTVNTLLKDTEITQVYDYLLPLYEAGLDAVIVQDMGVFRLVKSAFPNLSIHCSTQMNITSCHAAKLMKKLGACRIVTAREMSIEEIARLHEQVDIEIETFVHGAMCYSYSGQCLMSSLAGGRSGNRGRCAQPCRKCYDGSYVLSMKDLCTLEHIPELIQAGVHSLKIEGRMKNAQYVASAVHAYRQVVDAYMEGSLTDKMILKLRFELANVFNRGNFTDGYMKKHNGEDMVSLKRPNNQGVCVGEIVGIKDGAVKIHLLEPLYKQDVLELSCKQNEVVELTSAIEGKANQAVCLNCKKTKQLIVGSKVYRTRCNQILEHIDRDYILSCKRTGLTAKLKAHIGERISLTVEATVGHQRYVAVAKGDVVDKANRKIDNLEHIEKPLSQLGNTDYEMRKLQLDVDADAFLPGGLLKKLRREALHNLEEAILNAHRRQAVFRELKKPYTMCEKSETSVVEGLDVSGYTCAVSNLTQLETLLFLAAGDSLIRRIVVNLDTYLLAKRSGLLSDMEAQSIECYIELPFVIRQDNKLPADLQSDKYSGIYIRNIDSLAMVLSTTKCCGKKLLLGASLYCYNGYAYDFYRELCEDFPVVEFEMPRELNKKELIPLFETKDVRMLLYEYQPVMITANCIQKTRHGCNHNNSMHRIVDDLGHAFYGVCHCDSCINVIYNGIPYNIIGHRNDRDIKEWCRDSGVLRFTIEDKEELTAIYHQLTGKTGVKEPVTSGHLFRGVE